MYNAKHIFEERSRLDRVKGLKERLENAKHELEVALRQGQLERASQLRYATIPDLEGQLPKEDEHADETESPLSMLHDRVTSNDIARVVAKATGIPVQNLLKGERDKLVHVSHRISLILPSEMRLDNTHYLYLTDGRCAPSTGCGSGPCCDCCQRCCPDLSCWTSSTQPTRRFILVLRSDWCREGMHFYTND